MGLLMGLLKLSMCCSVLCLHSLQLPFQSVSCSLLLHGLACILYRSKRLHTGCEIQGQKGVRIIVSHLELLFFDSSASPGAFLLSLASVYAEIVATTDDHTDRVSAILQDEEKCQTPEETGQ